MKCPAQANPETKSRCMVARGWEEWGVMTANGYGVPFWGDENVLKLDRDDICNSECTKKPLNCILGQGELYGM